MGFHRETGAVLALEMSQEISQAGLEQPERTEIVLGVTLGGL